MYADSITRSMQQAIEMTEQRRSKQQEFNKKHGIVPKTIYKKVHQALVKDPVKEQDQMADLPNEIDQDSLIAQLEKEMLEAADQLEFEKAAKLRDRIQKITSTKK